MSFADIFIEEMKAMMQGDTIKLEQLAKIHSKKVAEIQERKRGTPNEICTCTNTSMHKR